MTARTALRAASPTCPTNKQRPSSPSNLSGNGLATSKGLWTRGCPSKHVKEKAMGRSGLTRKYSSYWERRRHSRFSRRGPRIFG